MFSRPGKSTISQYLCFSDRKKLKAKIRKERNKFNLDLEHQVKMFLKDRLKHTDVLEKTSEDYIMKNSNESTTISKYLKHKHRLGLGTKNILKNIKRLSLVPPPGYYQPDYDFIKPRVSSVCFHKSKERKLIFSSQTQNKNDQISQNVAFKSCQKKQRKYKRPVTSISRSKNTRSRQLSPVNSKTKYNINLLSDPLELLSHNNTQINSPTSPCYKRSTSSMSNLKNLFMKNPDVSSPKLTSANTTFIDSNMSS